jgi:membrane-associated phospholipid phosphatase
MNSFTDKREAGPASADPLQGQPVRSRLYILAIILALGSALLWPFDMVLSDMLRISGSAETSMLLFRLARIVKLFGKGEILLLLGLLLAIYRHKEVAIAACLSLLLAGLIILPTKFAFERQRPNGANFQSFPSGDAAAVTAFLVPVASAFPSSTFPAAVGIATIGAARVAFGYHYPSDVLAGIAIGIFAVAVVLSLKISSWPGFRRLLRRGWVVAALGFLVLIRLPASGNNMKEFLSIFGLPVALLVMVPFVRSWLQTRGQK